MTALLDPPVLLGVQFPRLSWMPPGEWDSATAERCIVWARDVLKVDLDEWQRLLLRQMLATRRDGRWVCRQHALVCSRQNGKSLVLLVRCLFGLIVLDERKTVYSVHHGDTARDLHILLLSLLKDPDTDETRPGVTPFTPLNAPGREQIKFHNGRSLRMKTRTISGGRGVSGVDVLVLDEAQELVDAQMDAVSPSIGARSMTGNPQTLYAGSAGHYQSVVFARQRRRALAGTATGMGFAEWSIDDEVYLGTDLLERESLVLSLESWAQANPTFHMVRPDGSGGLSTEFLTDELEQLSLIGFAREHLGIGTWPPDDSADWLIPRAKWAACADPESPPPAGAVALAVGAAWDRTVSVGVCGARADGLVLGELTHYGAGPVVEIVKEVIRLRDAHRPVVIVVDDKGPVDFLIAPLEAAGVALERLSVRDVAAATSGLHAAVTEASPAFRHRGQPEVAAALAGARRKDVGDGWVLDRRRSAADVTPLEVLALARWGFVKFGEKSYDLLNSVW